MTRVVDFVDSFSSATAPTTYGGTQENYLILNNQAVALALFTIDASDFKSAFISFELERTDISNEYRQVGHIVLDYDGANWNFNLGNYQGDSIINDTLANIYNIVLSITTSVGVGSLKYTSGNMSTSYSGNMKIFITRIVIV